MDTLITLFSILAFFIVCAASVTFAVAVFNPKFRQRALSFVKTVMDSLVGRLILVGVTTLTILIPLTLVDDVRRERSGLHSQVEREVQEEWGAKQTVLGPFIVVPIVHRWETKTEVEDKKAKNKTKVIITPHSREEEIAFLPHELKVNATTDPQKLNRGLYELLVYRGKVSIDADFVAPPLPVEEGVTATYDWSRSHVVTGISDLSAITEVTSFEVDGTSVEASNSKYIPTSVEYNSIKTGIGAATPHFDGAGQIKLEFNFRGSDGLFVSAAGKESTIEISGDWGSPSFSGFTLPDSRSVEDNSYGAKWKIPSVARSLPNRFELATSGNIFDTLNQPTVGVRLLSPTAPYIGVERAMKYGMLVILLALLTVFILEFAMKVRLHPAQWIINGIAMAVFYLILLALSEHIGFDYAYGVASGITILMISTYSALALKRMAIFAFIAASMSVLYGAMFAMLLSESHSLVMGTGLLVAALAAIMWITKSLHMPTHNRATPIEVEPA